MDFNFALRKRPSQSENLVLTTPSKIAWYIQLQHTLNSALGHTVSIWLWPISIWLWYGLLENLAIAIWPSFVDTKISIIVRNPFFTRVCEIYSRNNGILLSIGHSRKISSVPNLGAKPDTLLTSTTPPHPEANNASAALTKHARGIKRRNASQWDSRGSFHPKLNLSPAH